LELAKELEHAEGLAKTYSSLSNVYWLQGKQKEAIETNLKSINVYQNIGNVTAVAGGRANMAGMYANKQGYTEAIKIAGQALDTFQILGIPRGLSVTCQTLAESHLALNQLDQAQKYANMVIETEETEGIPDALRVLGEIQLKRGKHPQAQQHIQQSIDLAIENQDPFLEAYGWRALGQVYQSQQDEIEAKASFDKAIALFEEMGLENEIEKTQAMVANP